jgi:DNA polymerase-3 subunit beta
MVATDGHRLYLQKLELPGAIGSWPAMSYMQGVIVPSKTVAMLSKLMRGKKCPDFIAMTIASNACRFVFSTEFGEVTVLSKNIDGTFPDYRRVVPAHSNFPAARFDRCGLAEGIKAASLISSEKSRAFKLSVSGNGASVTVNSPENGSAHADMPCKWESDETEIGFNAGYMLDALDIAGSGETAIYIQDSSSPAVVTGAREGWLAVIMPMRV